MDDRIKGRYGLPEALHLVDDDDDVKLEAKVEWEKGKRELEMKGYAKRQRLSLGTSSMSVSSASSRPMSSSSQSRSSRSNDVVTSLRARILENTSRKSNPFSQTQSADEKTRSRFGVRK